MWYLKNGQGQFLRMTSARHDLAQTPEGRAQIVRELSAAKPDDYTWTQDTTNAIPVDPSPDQQ